LQLQNLSDKFLSRSIFHSLFTLAGDAIVRSDADMQTMLLSNLILTGGCACIDGLSERLKTEGERSAALLLSLCNS